MSDQYSLMLTVKHVLIAAMVFLSILRSQGLNRIGLNPERHNRISALVLILNTIIGIVVLFISGILAGLSAMA